MADVTRYSFWTFAELERELRRRASWRYCFLHPFRLADHDAFIAEVDSRIEAKAERLYAEASAVLAGKPETRR